MISINRFWFTLNLCRTVHFEFAVLISISWLRLNICAKLEESSSVMNVDNWCFLIFKDLFNELHNEWMHFYYAMLCGRWILVNPLFCQNYITAIFFASAIADVVVKYFQNVYEQCSCALFLSHRIVSFCEPMCLTRVVSVECFRILYFWHLLRFMNFTVFFSSSKWMVLEK